MRPLEAVRAYVEGRLTPEERALVEADARLNELAEAYAAICRAAEREPPPCATTFEQLALAPGRGLLRPLLAAAAALLLVGSGALLLRSDPLPETPAPAYPPDLAHYDPADGDHPRWLWDTEQALGFGALFERPVLLFVDYPGCPYCEEYDRRIFPAEPVRAPLREFVPLRTSWTPEVAERYRIDPSRGMPVFLVLNGEGEELARWAGLLRRDAFVSRLREALSTAREAGLALLDWRKIRDAAR